MGEFKKNDTKKGLKRLNQRSKNWANSGQASRLNESGRKVTEQKRLSQAAGDALDARFGFVRYEEYTPRLGWLLNMKPTTLEDSEGKEKSALDLYFLQQDGSTFKATIRHEPYFYVSIVDYFLREVAVLLQKKFSAHISNVTIVEKEDLDMNNHLSGIQARYVKLSFPAVADLMDVRKQIMPLIPKNRSRWKTMETYQPFMQSNEEMPDDILETIIDIREYDVPYYVRVSIDLDIRVGAWYTVSVDTDQVLVQRQNEMVDKAEPIVFAFDIECTKAPLKFPDAEVDQIFMISYMVDGKGFLIINREIVSEDIEDFEYTPKPEYPGPFHVFNELNEHDLLRRFYDHIKEIKPHIYVTYNGDFFDWPFIENRSKLAGIDLFHEIGISADKSGEYRGKYAVHMDAFCWVKRDSYLPQGSQGLKAVTKYKLGYDPVEVDPENMVRFAIESPSMMASYSVSDAVATFYLYEKYVHLFVFSLCTIIPMGSEDVLRKGSGTLCEALLMVEAFTGNIVCPNKENSADSKYYKGHLVESETYVGGHVECLESGVFRSDIPCKFRLTPEIFDELISNIDRDLKFALEVEHLVQLEDVENYESVKTEIIEKLQALKNKPNRTENPLIYHLDVGAMYPNIILTNRLQPCAIVNESICATCVHNRADNDCKRKMEWVWRGDFYPAKKNECDMIKSQLMTEKVNGVPFNDLPQETSAKITKQRIKTYCSKVYKKLKKTEEQKRIDTVCMRENPFYVNTVRAFRDRRYEYKMLTKTWKDHEKAALQENDPLKVVFAKNKTLVYDSLQLAHKCILNSFYGYVMRKGARWHSMEMAGIVTNTGSTLITRARELVEKIGRPLELDTDGIWCILPKSFPENFSFVMKNGSKKYISYPCVMLNADVNEKYTNHQYQDLVPGTKTSYKKKSECSIFFEVDGPYRCMLLPSSTEEGRLLKKRYAVFNMNGSLAELKGFELKRRGELQLIKAFQSQVFERFLHGNNLQECYASVAECGNHWLDVIDSKGEDMDDDELLELITENRNMSGRLSDYGAQKSTSITTARRLGEFLGDEMLRDKGLNCKMIISKKPSMSPVTDRAIPTLIFAAESAVKKHFLRKWLKDPGMSDFDIRNILDWDYYRSRLGNTIQKIITLPASFQNVPNPVPRVPLPDWMRRRVKEIFNPYQQTKLKGFVPIEKPQDCAATLMMMDIEDVPFQGYDVSSRKKNKSSSGNSIRHVFKNKSSEKENDVPLVMENTNSLSPYKDLNEKQENEVELVMEKNNTYYSYKNLNGKHENEFDDWLKDRKQRWKHHRILRKRQLQQQQQQESSLSSSALDISTSTWKKKRGTTNTAIDNFLQEASHNVNHSHWQVLEMFEMDPGVFKLWILTSKAAIQSIVVKVPRQFLMNSRTPQESAYGKKVVRTLPREKKAYFLQEMTMSERQFRENKKIISDLISDPEVEGIYEMKVPSTMRAVIHLGCVARVKESRRNRPATLKDPFVLEDLERMSSLSNTYLTPQSSVFKRIFLYYSFSNDCGIIGLFFITGTNVDRTTTSPLLSSNSGSSSSNINSSSSPNKNTKSHIVSAAAQIWLANPYDTSTLNISNIFESRRTSPESQCSFTLNQTKSLLAALHGVNQALALYSSSHDGPTIILAQSPLNRSKLRQQIPVLDSFPICRYHWNDEDAVFPALLWQKKVAETMVQRFIEADSYWDELVACSRFSLIPIGNFSDDHAAVILDILYSRTLIQNKHALWVSPSNKPDLGGMEMDENEIFADDLQITNINCSGSYRRICVELQLEGLAVNTLLIAPQIHDIEGTFDSMKDGFLEGVGSVHSAFNHLRSVVLNLFRELSSSGNPLADFLLQHIYRWLCSPSSQSYDPALHQMIYQLMEKLFLQLLAELRRLGCHIVHATFSRIIVYTKKDNFASAEEYTTFLIDTIVSNELFQVLNITATQYWKQLLFLDSENYGGIPITSMEKEELKVVSHWNIANYLPDAVSDYFLIIVGQYLKRQAEFIQNQDQDENAVFSQSNVLVVEEANEEKLRNYLQKLVRGYMTDKFLSIIPRIIESNIGEEDFPKLAGSHRYMANPALELITMSCRVLCLEPAVNEEVEMMKKTLLKFIGYSEFDAAAEFINPSLIFILPDVICLDCNYSRHLDLCRDPDLLDESQSEDETWRCPRCHSMYNKSLIEMRLVEIAQQMSLKYQVQDLYCIKCSLPNEDRMKEFCSCSGTYERSVPSMASFEKGLLSLRNIGVYYNFLWLQETIHFLMETTNP